MNAVGVVVEYNPFHNGHAFHLEQTRTAAKADVVIAVMSGPFLQRGEPALLPKWTRAKMAIQAGVDIVLELPYSFATQKADTFAYGAISILGAIGCSSVCFGSESGNIEDFLTTISFLEKNRTNYEKYIKTYMEKGFNYPTALSSAFLDLEPNKNMVDLSKPNNILGFQYVKAIQRLGLPMKPLTIPRSQAGYHDEQFTSETIASATSIRKALFSDDGTIEKIISYVPETTSTTLYDYKKQYGQFQQWENYWPYLKFRVLQSTSSELRQIYEVEEGLENRVFRAALASSSFEEFMKRLKTKRYTWTRLQRMCVHILTNTTTEEMTERMREPSYIRLLGMNEKGRTYLNKWKSHESLPLISKLSSHQGEDIALDIRASRIYALGADKGLVQPLIDMDYKQPPIYLP